MKFNIFELGIFSFNSYVYYLTRGFIASTRAFNILTRAFNLPTRAFSLPTRAFNLATRAFSVLTRGFELITRKFELGTRNSSLREKCPNTEIFLVGIFLYFPVIQENTDQKKLRIWTLSTQCVTRILLFNYF